MLRKLVQSLFFFLLGCLISPALPGVAADHFPEVMFIMDSSGSMSEDAGGTHKMAAAKKVMHLIVPALDENVRVGLTAYGHRRPGDCQDIEVLVPPGSDDRAKLLAQVDQLKPTGKTPISAAILSTASLLRMKDAETTIILVSDGIETCGGDPCQVVKQLKATGSKFVMHVVGFDVGLDAAKQLNCVAGAGGGKYFSAANADELLTAMETVAEEIQKKVNLVDPAVIASVSGQTGLGKLRIRMPVGSEVSLANLKITRTDGQAGNRTVESPKADATYPVKSGQFSVELGFATPSYGAPLPAPIGTIEVNKGEVKDLNLGSISLNLPEHIVSQIAVDQVIISDAGTNKVVVTVRKNGNSYYHYKPKPILAGVYNVMFQYSINRNSGPSIVARNVVVEPGKDTVVTLDSGFQLKKAADVIGWDLIAADGQVADATEDGTGQQVRAAAVSIRYTGTGSRDRLWYPHLLPPGRYNLNVLVEGMDEAIPAGEGIVIGAGQMLNFDSGL